MVAWSSAADKYILFECSPKQGLKLQNLKKGHFCPSPLKRFAALSAHVYQKAG